MKKVLLLALMATFSLAAFCQTEVLNETFDGNSIPDGWTVSSTNAVGWEVGSPAALSSQYWTIPSHDGNCAAANDDALGQTGNSSDVSLSTPALDLSGLESCFLTFDAFSNGSYGSLGTVLVSTDSAATPVEVYTIPYMDVWQTINVDLSSYVGNNSVVVTFKSTDQGYWADGIALDNVNLFAPGSNSANFVGIASGDFAETNSEYELIASVSNMGGNNITSLNVSWSTNDGQSADALIDGLNIEPLSNSSISLPDMVSIGTDNVDVDVTITSVNESSESSITNPTQSITVVPLAFLPTRKVVTEEATGTWCGWCPRGAVNLDLLGDTYTNSIEIAVHNDDPMADPTYNGGMVSQIAGFPSGLCDRQEVIDPLEFEDAYLDRIDQQAVLSVGVLTDFNSGTRDLTATITATFAGNFSGDYRINAVVVEDHVTGTGSGYNQNNYYANNANGPMGGYENLPAAVPAADMVYRHVGRAILGGWSGSSDVIPSDVEISTDYTKTYTYNVPESYDESEISVVGMVINNSNGQIMNAEESGMITSTEELANFGFDFELYPNPANTTSNILLQLKKADNVSYSVYNLSGKKVAGKYLGQVAPGEYLHTVNVESLQSGMYFISITVGENQISRKLSIQ